MVLAAITFRFAAIMGGVKKKWYFWVVGPCKNTIKFVCSTLSWVGSLVDFDCVF